MAKENPEDSDTVPTVQVDKNSAVTTSDGSSPSEERRNRIQSVWQSAVREWAGFGPLSKVGWVFGVVAFPLGLIGYNFGHIVFDEPTFQEIVEQTESQTQRRITSEIDRLRTEIAREKGFDPNLLKPLFDAAEKKLPQANFDAAIRQAIDAILAKANDTVPDFAGDETVEAVIEAAREKLSIIDTAGAQKVLKDDLTNRKKQLERQRLQSARIARELGEVSAAAFDWDQAVEAFELAASMNPADVWASIRAGDINRLRGSLSKSLGNYETAHSMAEDLIRSEPTRLEWQRDLSVSHNKIGDVEVAQGNLGAALTSYQAGMEIAERLAQSDPGNSEWQRDLIVSHVKLAGSGGPAREHLSAALAIATRLQAQGRLVPADDWMVDDLQSRLDALDD